MKLEINTTTKEIRILESVSLSEFYTEIQVLDINIDEYKLIPMGLFLNGHIGLDNFNSGTYNPRNHDIMYGNIITGISRTTTYL